MDKNVHSGADVDPDMVQKGQKCPFEKRPKMDITFQALHIPKFQE